MTIEGELRLADEARRLERERLTALRATVLDQSLPLEARLAAYMRIDAWIFAKRRSVVENLVDATSPDAIALAKARSEQRRLNRKRQARIDAGLPVRPRRNLKTEKVNGECDSADPQNRASIGSPDQPATSVPRADRLTSGDLNGSIQRMVAQPGPSIFAKKEKSRRISHLDVAPQPAEG